jgi:hypothetical protein
VEALLSSRVPDGQIDSATGQADFLVEERRLKRGHVLGVKHVLDVSHDQRRLAHAALAEEHHLEIVAPAAADLGVHRVQLRRRTPRNASAEMQLGDKRITASKLQKECPQVLLDLRQGSVSFVRHSVVKPGVRCFNYGFCSK